MPYPAIPWTTVNSTRRRRVQCTVDNTKRCIHLLCHMKHINESIANTHEAIKAVEQRLKSALEGDAASWPLNKNQNCYLYYKDKLVAVNEERMRLIEQFERLKRATRELERANAANGWEVE